MPNLVTTQGHTYLIFSGFPPRSAMKSLMSSMVGNRLIELECLVEDLGFKRGSSVGPVTSAGVTPARQQ